MRTKLSAFLLVLLVAVLAHPAHAQFTTLDDPLLTTGDDTDRIIISATAAATDQSSPAFNAQHATRALLTVVVSACTSCNVQPQLQMQNADGTWFIYAAFTALTADGTTRYLIQKGTTLGTDEITLDYKADLPGRWRWTMFRVAGSATIVVSGVVW